MHGVRIISKYDETYFHLGYDTVPFGNWFHTFRDTGVVSSSWDQHFVSKSQGAITEWQGVVS